VTPDTVAGLFETRSQADLALRNLKDAGFGAEQPSSRPAGRGAPLRPRP